MNVRLRVVVFVALSLSLISVAWSGAAQPGAGGGAASARAPGPCDIYAAAGFPCVAAHSTTRALSAGYNGPLYQVKRDSDGQTLDIGIVQPVAGPAPDAGGYADAAAQDAFCSGTTCWITTVYDQSGQGNDRVQAPPGTFAGPAKGGFNTLPMADMAPITIGGHKAYGVYIMPGMGLRDNDAKGLAINDEPEGITMVFDGTHFDSGCCFNYGNTSTNSRAVGTGTMETVYFGTATNWGRGSGTGPWIMSDMEAGLFSGYEARLNEGSPTIDSWRFVTGVVNGGGGNQWDLRGGNAQEGGLTTFYSGPRPGSMNNSSYYPMHRKGAIQMGNGGDNGNGSAGTFYEGVMTTGYPTDAAINAVQANIVAAKYDVARVEVSRVTSFTPGSTQEVTVLFTNTTGAEVTGLKLSVDVPTAWKSVVVDSNEAAKSIADPVAPGANVRATFAVTSAATSGGGFLVGKAEWTNSGSSTSQSDSRATRARNVLPVKINEVMLGGGANPTNQFIELYNAGETAVDVSGWRLIHTQSQWSPGELAKIPAGTSLAPGGFYVLGLAPSGLASPASTGATTIYVRSTDGLEAGQQIQVGGETRTIASVGTPAAAMTTVFIPVSTGPWMTIPVGSTNLPVTSAAGFEVGEKIGIDINGNYEVATVTAVGKASTQTTLSEAAAAGATAIKVNASGNLSVGDSLTIDTGARKEVVVVQDISPVAPGAAGANDGARGRGRRGRGGGGVSAEIELTAPLRMDHMASVDVSSTGTGITFTPATRFVHRSGDAVQALGSGVTLDSPLANGHAVGAPVIGAQSETAGYQGPPAPNLWFGGELSARAGSIALVDASGKVVVDAIVYGSQQSNSSANGTIASPELAVLEGDQSQGGCIAVAPNAGGGRGRGRGRGGAGAAATPNRSLARVPDGTDSDNNCRDFVTLTAGVEPGSGTSGPSPGAANR